MHHTFNMQSLLGAMTVPGAGAQRPRGRRGTLVGDGKGAGHSHPDDCSAVKTLEDDEQQVRVLVVLLMDSRKRLLDR